ncbi:c-type cytochrome [Mucilaginibacter gotjawali]|uniref:Mono/diheme cytochrome c family protein n=2 Tax=Mucilaginibacter gotjawali TaxID=1550579 RepID=A0A839SDC8_9SPHI|nr:cytochrome c [Mucilaginibacter gotjawali]MBB3056211.1 mono/diheme cytochrome c family protein [Mucilaginibacter gotjawali]BAU53447.1 Cytochrome c [Mucilaginibacter gotjawali]
MKSPFPKSIFLGLLVAVAITALTSSVACAQSKPWIAPAVAQAMKNPVASTPDVLKAAKTLYITNCAPCHGEKGKGDGPAAASLTPHPADHTSAALRNEPDGSLFWKLSEGRTPMPQYKKILTETQRWQLIDYIRSLSKSK